MLGTVWVVGEQQFSCQGIAASLMGNYPVRAFASLHSFKSLIRIHKGDPASVFLIDTTKADIDIKSLENLIHYYAPDSYRLYVVPSGKASTLRPVGNSLAEQAHIIEELENNLDLIHTVGCLLKAKSDKAKGKNRHLKYKDLTLDIDSYKYKTLMTEEPISLSLKEARLLKFFLEHPKKCLSRDEIKEEVWPEVSVSSRTVDSHISRLRKKVCHGEVKIESRYGSGYIMS